MIQEEYKGYVIRTAEHVPTMKEIVTIGKGSTVLELRGLYTTVAFAKQAIDLYSPREKGATKDAKTDAKA